MKRVSSLRYCGLLPIMLSSAAIGAPRSASQQSVKVAAVTKGVIPLFQSDDRVMVMMRIGDGDLLPMVFDTGSDGHSIDSTIVKRYKLKRIGYSIELDGTTGKQRKLASVALPNVTLGGLQVGTLEAVALDYDRNDAMGIISPEMFTNNLIYLELGKNRARLVPRATASMPQSAAVPYFLGTPTVELVMPDGSTMPAHFDTGYNGALSLPTRLMGKVPLMGPAKVVGRFKSINTEGEVWGGRIRGTIRIGPVVLENPDITFLGDLANIGLPVIRQITLVIDPAEKRSWTLAAQSVRAPDRN